LRRLLIALVVWLLLALASPAQAQFLNDGFTEGGGNVTLDLHTPDTTGGTWVEHGSYPDNCTVDAANDYLTAPAGGFCLYYNDASPATADYSVVGGVFVVSNAAASYPGVAGRVATGANTAYRVYYDQVGGQWVLDKMVAGANTGLGTFSQSLTNSQTYAMKLEMIGTAIKVYIDDVQRISVTDGDIAAAGKAAAMQVTNSGQQLTSIVATDIGGGGGSTTRSLGLLGVGQ
jgi:hypothetical protein